MLLKKDTAMWETNKENRLVFTQTTDFPFNNQLLILKL